MLRIACKVPLLVIGLVLFALLRPVQAVPINAISLSYFPLIPQPGQPQDTWKLDTRQTRISMGLDPTGAPIDDTFGEYNLTFSEVRGKVSRIQGGAAAALEEGSRYHGYNDASAVKSVEYNFLTSLELLEPVPLSNRLYNGNPLPDYLAASATTSITKA